MPPLTQQNGQNRMTEDTSAPGQQCRLNSANLSNLNSAVRLCTEEAEMCSKMSALDVLWT